MQTSDPAGLVNLYKPPGWSSARYVYRLRPIFGLRKVGHAGTLDPFAEGVLVACVGTATRLVERIMALPKRYRTSLRLGVTNATLDPEQPFEPVEGATPPAREAIERVLGAMTGEIEQVPPAFSAARISGVSAYKLVKAGRPVGLRPRRVRIDRIEIVDYAWPRLTLSITCGRGTYVRAIARDLGRALGCGACCETLCRDAVGPFHMDASVRLLDASPEAVRGALIGADEARRLIDTATEALGATRS